MYLLHALRCLLYFGDTCLHIEWLVPLGPSTYCSPLIPQWQFVQHLLLLITSYSSFLEYFNEYAPQYFSLQFFMLVVGS